MEYIWRDIATKPHKHVFRCLGHNVSQNILGVENVYYCECGEKLVERALEWAEYGSAPVKR